MALGWVFPLWCWAKELQPGEFILHFTSWVRLGKYIYLSSGPGWREQSKPWWKNHHHYHTRLLVFLFQIQLIQQLQKNPARAPTSSSYVFLSEMMEKQEALRNHSFDIIKEGPTDEEQDKLHWWCVTVSSQRNGKKNKEIFLDLEHTPAGPWALWQSCFYPGAVTKCSGPAADRVSAFDNKCSECCRCHLARLYQPQDLRVWGWPQELPSHLQDRRILLVLVLIPVLTLVF